MVLYSCIALRGLSDSLIVLFISFLPRLHKLGKRPIYGYPFNLQRWSFPFKQSSFKWCCAMWINHLGFLRGSTTFQIDSPSACFWGMFQLRFLKVLYGVPYRMNTLILHRLVTALTLVRWVSNELALTTVRTVVYTIRETPKMRSTRTYREALYTLHTYVSRCSKYST